MAVVGDTILYIIMACCVIGGIATIVKEDSGLAQSFHNGISTMASMFIPICGLMAAVPVIKIIIEVVFGKLFRSFGADPTVVGAMIMPPDCGSYALAMDMGQTTEILVIVIAVGFMCASTIAFNVPIGLSILDKKDIDYLALGTMSGFLSVPFGVFVTCMITMATSPALRSVFSSTAAADYIPQLTIRMILVNLVPIIVICALLAIGLKLAPRKMLIGFKWFGKILTSIMTAFVVISIVEHYTGVFSNIFGGYILDPLIADDKELFRAVELLGTIAMMLAGAFPMVHLIQKYLRKPLEKIGKLLGLSGEGSVGLVACMANGLALFPLIKNMKPKDKVIAMAFLVCGGYCLGDFIAFDVNFQPNLVVAVFVGQIAGGVIGILFAKFLAVPQAEKLAAARELEEKKANQEQAKA
ncbi:ethanolamine utilization protein EutH [uncultured Roseburia sp.]|uniref:Ethanolamine utilization protein EutH n=1 Tax=Brotonthovivens ammoniilytica TaxID=2981725 RepID=A0ABT2TF27_9FIRM|nr:ethanolamine utilization protein EutH [Brotonthovivens ammoniilytica]MCU6760785.1 ethanolamine utilization protein EutH [Brotonthovivens ammoniilytica]SCI09195.1 ethanolamine utilization protein EutH [uncultured Roseburia sp.]